MQRRGAKTAVVGAAALLLVGAIGFAASYDDEEEPVERSYTTAPPTHQAETREQADAESAGCRDCHTVSDAPTMHRNDAVILGCTACHGGNAGVHVARGLAKDDPAYEAARDSAHVLPRYPKAWNFPSAANPQQSYTLLNREAPEFIRFVNPSDYRVVRESCGACHLEVIQAAERSLMATGAMFFEGASYNNGVLPFKSDVIGEAYTRDGKPARILSPGNPPGQVTGGQAKRGALPSLIPLPQWQVIPPADIFRVFERGGRNIGSQFPEIGLPDATGELQRLEEPGRPDIRQSNRGPGTGLRIAIPVLNLHKTRLNDPYMWFMGTNEQPGDYRQSGCAGCHVVYANDREPRDSFGYAKYGRDGQSVSVDPTISRSETGHPLRHEFTRAIPTAQCMTCHMHQPNMFLNSFLGYTMWDYESDAPFMWPERQKFPTAEEVRKVLDRNPEGAAPRGKWADLNFLRNVYDLNPKLKDTQFADYHGHGWNFRAVFKRDRAGNLLDANGYVVRPNDPEKWRRNGEGKFVPPGTNPGKAVQLMDIHAEKGMQCVDCHFAQDNHGNGFILGEVANGVEIRCKDCHGTIDAYPNLRTSGPAAPSTGTDLSVLRNPDGKRRFEWATRAGRRTLIQHSVVDSALEWKVSLVKDTVDPASPDFNIRAARAKLMSRTVIQGRQFQWGPGVNAKNLAHKESEMECFTCHTSWTPSCGGCHLPIEANWKAASHRYEGGFTRNYATYNPQVARDDMFQLGLHSTVKGNTIAPVRSSSALILSSTNINRERIYVQQPPISAAGFSSQAFAPHFPHTVRKTETKTCSDCHVSQANDNNAIMAQLLLLGTNFVNFVGLHAWVGLEDGFEAIRVTEWQEPQAVFGSYLQRYAYPDYYKLHVGKNHRELIDWTRGATFDADGSGETNPAEDIRNIAQSTGGAVHCLQLRGEYLYVAEGKAGFEAYDVASVGNKDISNKVITAPFSPLGHNTHVATKNATCLALPTNQSIAPLRNTPEIRTQNQEQPFHPVYHYAFITDSEEGLIVVNIDSLTDREPRNNFFSRALTWNEGGILNGARHITMGGHFAYIAANAGLVVLNLDDPLKPRVASVVKLPDVRASALQFRYLFVTDARGLEVLDVTRLDRPQLLKSATVKLADAHRIYVARTYAYVAAKREGLVIVNVEKPEHPLVDQRVTLGGQLNDAEDVIVGSTNASLFAYVADGRNGFKVLQLTSPATQPNFYGFSPRPVPELIAWARTRTPALALSKGLDRDRAVDETGHQIAVLGRLGSRPFTRAEMEKFFIDSKGDFYKVRDTTSFDGFVTTTGTRVPASKDPVTAPSRLRAMR
ncbi:MAG TPA: multiheme c-type cytochrome [Rhizomicrobium sp.]|nr:multiheme c-type cytochrome [Rhizomicrobium sp.]